MAASSVIGALADRATRVAEAVLAFLLAGMVVMVFGNVVLRYAFDSGIVVSEELSRFFFVWLTFIGAVVAMREGTHLGMDGFVSRLPRRGKLACLLASQTIVLGCCAMMFRGTWLQHEVNATTMAPVTGLSTIWVFGMGYVASVGIGVQAAARIVRILAGRIGDDELVQVAEEDAAPAHAHPDAAPAGQRPAAHAAPTTARGAP